MVQEVFLHLDDALRDRDERAITQLQAGQQPASLLQPSAQVFGILSARLSQQADVVTVELEAGVVVRAQADTPFALDLSDIDIRHQVFVPPVVESRPGPRLEGMDQIHPRPDSFRAGAGELLKFRQLAIRDEVDEITRNPQGEFSPGRIPGKCQKLHPYALCGVAAGHAHRFHSLHTMKDRGHFLRADEKLGGQTCADLLNRIGQETVLVQGVDDCCCDFGVESAETSEIDLPQQVVAQ